MSGNNLISLSELSTELSLKRQQFYWIQKVFMVDGTGGYANLPIIESISWSSLWDLRMTKSFFWPCGLLELTWIWSGPRAWQHSKQILSFQNLDTSIRTKYIVDDWHPRWSLSEIMHITIASQFSHWCNVTKCGIHSSRQWHMQLWVT